MRVNLVRLAALLVFYGHHLSNVLFFGDDLETMGRYHTAATAVALAWSLTVLAIHLRLSLGPVRPWLSLAAIGADVLFITLLLCLSRDPKNALASLYYLVIISAGVRVSLPLVVAASLASLAGYGIFQGYSYLWFDAAQAISRPSQVISFLSLGAAGLLTGQMVRQARRMAQADESRSFCPRCHVPLPVSGESAADDNGNEPEGADATVRRDNVAFGVGLILMSALLGFALFWPASNANLDLDALVGLTFGLVLLGVAGPAIQLRRIGQAMSLERGGLRETAFAGMALVVMTAMLFALAIAVLKTYY